MVRVKRRPNRLTEKRERGAVLVLALVMLSAMLSFAALVIDISNAMQTRRQAQNSADAAALAAAQDLPNASAVVATAKQYVYENMGIASTSWVGCSDPQALSRLPDAANSNTCISIDNAFQRVRVQLPRRNVAMFFGKFMGASEISVTAHAVAEAILRGDDRIIPAAVTASQGTGNLCIENSGSNQDCDSRTSGNFGDLDSPRLRIYKPSASEDPNSLRTNYAMSLDHEIQIYGGSGATKVCDGDQRSPCGASNYTAGYKANHMNVYTGNAIPPATDGLVKGFTINTDDQGQVSFCGRLQRPDITPSNLTEPRPDNCLPNGPTITVLGTTVNGRHVYYWLHDWARQAFYPEVWSAENAANRGQLVLTNSLYTAGNARLECFLTSYRYNYATGVETVPTCPNLSLPAQSHYWGMFRKGMPTDSRFGMIPVLETWPNGGSTAVAVVQFWGIFLFRTYAGPTKLDGIDAWVFEPALIETQSGQPGMQFGFQADPVIRLVE